MSMNIYKSTQYPSIVGSPYGWWHKPMAPNIAFTLMVVLVILIFLLGIWFTTQYLKIWSVVQVKALASNEELPTLMIQHIK